LLLTNLSGQANQNHNPIITRKVGLMSPQNHSRSGRHGTIWINALLVFAAAFALLAARDFQPRFPQGPSIHSAINALSTRQDRPRFDSNNLQWSAPVQGYLPLPPATAAPQLALSLQSTSGLQTKGFHYNRPPPAV